LERTKAAFRPNDWAVPARRVPPLIRFVPRREFVPLISIVPAPAFSNRPTLVPRSISRAEKSRSTSWEPFATVKMALLSTVRPAAPVTPLITAWLLEDRMAALNTAVGLFVPPNFSSPPVMFRAKLPPPAK